MNDRFKFRLFNPQDGTYCVGVHLIGGGDMIHEAVTNTNWNNGGSFIIEQCTGLKDNCGNLIYEGDIIGDGEDDYVIKWDSNRTMFVAEDIDTSYEIEDVLDPTICVIGNIHKQAEQKDTKCS